MSERPDPEAIFCDHEPFRARIEELEAERDALAKAREKQEDYLGELEAERDRLFAKFEDRTLAAEREFHDRTAAETREQKLREALTCIARPTMGLRPGTDPELFVRLVATNERIRSALETCIHIARTALDATVVAPAEPHCVKCWDIGTVSDGIITGPCPVCAAPTQSPEEARDG